MRYVALSIAVALLTGCGIPRDPEGTLDSVKGDMLRVGVVEHEPWVSLEEDEPSGIEVELVERFAGTLDARIEWFPGSGSEVFSALHVGTLDMVIGGLERTSPYAKEAALTHPYVTTQTVVGFPDEPGVDEDIAGLEVAVEKGTAAEGHLEKTDALVVPVEDVTAVAGPRVVENWMLDDLGLIDLGVQLDEQDHVMAVRLGENAFMTRLEDFLLANEDLIASLLEEVEP